MFSRRFVRGSERSLYREFLIVFCVIFVAVAVAAAPAILLIERSTGSGGAINVSGSLRMMSYRLTVAVSNPYATSEERRTETNGAVAEFDRRLRDSALLIDIPKDPDDPVRRKYEGVRKRFETDVRPLAIKSIEDASARPIFMRQIPAFVAEVDAFVAALEKTLGRRLALIEAILITALLGAFSLTYLMLRIMRRKIFEPLSELEGAVGQVRQGHFATRTKADRANDEIGRLGRGFNFMVSELERLYGSLEKEVAEKTKDLDRRNKGLEALAKASTVLLPGGDMRERLGAVLEQSVQFLNAQCAAVYLFEPAQKGMTPQRAVFVRTRGWEKAAGQKSGVERLSFSGLDADQLLGELCVQLPRGCPDWKKNFLSMLAALIGRAVAAGLRLEDDQRLAVLEERSTIARELHDSIAQTLSFSRIQVLRLKRAFSTPGAESDRKAIIEEIDMGISTAYRQLREVLTAFRLQIRSSGFSGIVNETVEAFRQRTGLPVEVRNDLLGLSLTPNEQVHFAHILSETLANVEKHARASHVEIRLTRLDESGFMLEVIDNGVGMPIKAEKAKHFGLGIMKERAQAIGAELFVEGLAPPAHGTRVRLIRKGRPEKFVQSTQVITHTDNANDRGN